MISIRKAAKLRELIELAAKSLSDDDAILGTELYPFWQPDMHYYNGDRVRDPEDGLLYKLIPADHISQSDWPPRLTPAIWRQVDNPEEEWPEWRQPLDSHDAYSSGAKVSHNGKHWINTFGDGNVWEPGVYGWELVDNS